MAGRSKNDDDFDEGVSLDSPYDAEEEGEELWFAPPRDAAGGVPFDRGGRFADDPFAMPVPEGERAPDWHDAKAWAEAEGRVGRPLAEAASAIARLDERLRREPAARRTGLLHRLALIEVSDCLWSEGIRLRPERLALAGDARIGRSADEDQAMARAAWAVRRLRMAATGTGSSGAGADEAGVPEPDGMLASRAMEPGLHRPFATPAGLRAFLGLSDAGRDARDRDVAEPDLRDDFRDDDLFERLHLTGPEDADLADWCRAVGDAKDLHPLTRAAMGRSLWRAFSLSAPGDLLTASVVAARLGAAGLGALTAIPVAFGGALTATRGGDADAGADSRLASWLGAVGEAATAACRHLDRLDDWEIEARAATDDLQGKGPKALIAHLTTRPITSANTTADALSITTARARSLLNIFDQRGLTHELTGHQKFRFWRVRIEG